MLNIRLAVEEDAVGFLEAMQSAESSNFMLFGPGERGLSIEGARKHIRVLNGGVGNALAIALLHEKVVGYIILKGEIISRLKHRASIVIGVHEAARGEGVGQALFSFIHELAMELGLHRLELTVMAHNEAALHVYQKMGYVIEGKRKHSLLVDGQFVDEFALAKILEE